MAAIDFPASPANGATFTPATGITYRYVTPPGIWTVANGPVDTVIASDLPPANPVPNQLWFNAALAMLYVYYDDGNTSQWVPSMPLPVPAANPPQTVLQTKMFQTGAHLSGTGVIPSDNTIPQITEGSEFMALAFTPLSAASKLVIDVSFMGSVNLAGGYVLGVALFRNGVADALGGKLVHTIGQQYLTDINFAHTMTSGTTSALTFSVRAGCSSATTTWMNGDSTPRWGGAVASSIVIQEVLP